MSMSMSPALGCNRGEADSHAAEAVHLHLYALLSFPTAS